MSQRAAERAADAIVKTSWWVRALTLVVGILTFITLVAYIAVNNQQATDQRARNMLILKEIQDAVNPDSQISQAGQARNAVVVKNLILCLENHEDRLAAMLARTSIPPRRAGCP